MLRQNRGRSIATIVGIVIAVGAVIVVIGIGEGVKSQVQGQANRLGRDLLLVRAGSKSKSLTENVGSLGSNNALGTLSDNDLHAVAAASGVRQAVPVGLIDGTVKTDEGRTNFSGSVIATTPEFVGVIRQDVKYGSFLTSGEGSNGRVVVGADVAAEIFGENVPLGRTIEFRGQEFIVSGVLQPFDSALLLGNTDLNRAIFINYEVAQQLTDNQLPIYQILAQASDASAITQTVKNIESKEAKVHGGASAVTVLRQGQSVAATDNILDLLTRFIIGAAGIALLIGGVGVMNIMLVSVTERMHEIGIRKAVGATNRQILSQFLVESAVLSAVGAIVGLFAGMAVLLLLRIYSDFSPTLPWLSGIMTMLIAIFIGALFGCVPALKAARKDPIEALRNA